MIRGIALALGLLAMGCMGRIQAQDGPAQSFENSTSKRIAAQPGATIRLLHSYGYLAVEGWDEPEAEIAVTKSTDRFYRPSEKNAAGRRLDRIQLDIGEPSPDEMEVDTTGARRNSPVTAVLPNGKSIFTLPLRPPNKQGVTVDYRIRIPRNSPLIVRQDNGYVCINGLFSNIEVQSHTGDIVVVLPEGGQYAIDAKTGLGSVASDFVGKWRRQLLVGMRLAYTDSAPVRHVRLRVGRGSITIKREIPSGPIWRN